MSLKIREGLVEGIQEGLREGLLTDFLGTPSKAPSGGGLPAVTVDASSGWFVPANPTEWAALLAYLGLPNNVPTQLWGLQESAAPFVDAVGGANLSANGSLSTQALVTGWTRKALVVIPGAAGSNYAFNNTTAGLSPGSLPTTLLLYGTVVLTPATTTGMVLIGDSNGLQLNATTAGTPQVVNDAAGGGGGSQTVSGTQSIATVAHPVLVTTDGGPSPTYHAVVTDLETASMASPHACVSASPQIFLGNVVVASAQAVGFLYATQWVNSSFTPAQCATLAAGIRNGH